MSFIPTDHRSIVAAGKSFVIMSADAGNVLQSTVMLTPAEARQLAIDLSVAAEMVEAKAFSEMQHALQLAVSDTQ